MQDLAGVQAEILDLHARYTDAVWRKDDDAFAALFTPDGEWRISGRVMRGRAEIGATIGAILGNFTAVLFTYRVPILHIDGDEVSARVMVDERCAWKNGNRNIAIGRYYERFARHEGRWLFSWRLFELHYRGPPDMTGQFFEHADYGPPPALPPRDTPTPDMASQRWGLEQQ
jgi:uncharacterized protein (TIGR02246 family)